MKAILAISLLIANIALAQVSPMNGYNYTDLKSMDEVMEIWNHMKKEELQGHSECFNRAHTWVYDMWKEFNVSSRKILIHFSYKYNKELSSKWGYHIAPMVSVNGVDYVMDKKYFDRPVTIPNWQKFFLKYSTDKLEKKRLEIVEELQENRRKIVDRQWNGTGLFEMSPESLRKENRKLQKELKYLQVSENKPAKISCPRITNIEQVDYQPTRQWCYLQKVSMYYWGYPQLRLLNYGQTSIPNWNDLSAKRNAGRHYHMDHWDMDQIWSAREEAFKDADKLWPYEYAIRQRSQCRDSVWGC